MDRPSRLILPLCALLSSWAMAAAAPALAGATVIPFHGRAISVPAGWPVYDLTRDPSRCVRLDRQAVYLGAPNPRQRCPARAIGRSRAIVIEQRGRRAIVLHGARAGSPSGGGSPTGAGTTTGAGSPTGAGHGSSSRKAALVGATFSGLGFDVCSAPTVTQMAAWRGSPYRAVGIYIGGANMGCAQPNLSAAWVSQESAAGWHLIPTYVGLQAPSNSCGCAGISTRQASAQGVAAANDAVAHAGGLGIGRGNPIYTDMEYYPRSSTNAAAVLAFLSGWTSQLHASGYQSGVYGNSDSVVADLLTKEGTGYPEPDDIWFAEWNGAQTTTSPWIPVGFWVNRRLHQYNGGHDATYGGVTLNIDSNAIDGATAAAGGRAGVPPPFADGTFVQVSGTKPIYRIAGGAPLVVHDWSSFGGTPPYQPPPYKVIGKRQFAKLNHVPASGTFLESTAGVAYRVAGGAALPITNGALFGTLDSAVTVDQWDIEHPANPLAHLNRVPADGTVVEGLPSGSYWVFQGGYRSTIAPTGTATGVEDAALAAFPLIPCVVPSLRTLTLVEAQAVLQAADCGLGTVRRRVPPRPHHFLHVVRQYPAVGSRQPGLSPVNVTLG
jgi:hypothetical protein